MLHAFRLTPHTSKRREVLKAAVQIVARLERPQGVQAVRNEVREAAESADGSAVAAVFRTLSAAGALIGPDGERVAGGNAELVADIRPQKLDDLDLMCCMVYRQAVEACFPDLLQTEKGVADFVARTGGHPPSDSRFSLTR